MAILAHNAKMADRIMPLRSIGLGQDVGAKSSRCVRRDRSDARAETDQRADRLVCDVDWGRECRLLSASPPTKSDLQIPLVQFFQ
jgi:hypothetical protein